MKKEFKVISLLLSIVFCFAFVAVGQETTGDIEGTVKDEQGSVVAGVTVTVSSKGGTAGFRRTAVTDSDGRFSMREVPPGAYNVSTEAKSGFGATTVENVSVEVGKTTSLPVTVKAGGVSATVDVTSTEVATIDTTGSQIQTNITTQQIENIPTGVSFASLLRLSPQTRPEAKSGGFQVDGASGSENSFIIDGQDVSNFKSNNLNGVNNIPTNLVQEVSIKTSGFDAEFGGATGAVVSVVTRGGGNSFRGTIGSEFVVPKLDAGPRIALVNVLAPNPSGQAAEYIQPKRSGGTDFFPTAQISGPILKDKLFGLVNYSRQIFNLNRTSEYYNNAPAASRVLSETVFYENKTIFEYGFVRLDANPTSNLRFSGTFLWNPQINEGGALPGTIVIGTGVPSAVIGGVTYRGSDLIGRQGGRVNSNNVTFSGAWTPNSKWIFTGRFSRGFLNEKPTAYFVPNATRFVCSGLSGTLGTFTPAQTGCQQGFQNIPANRLTNREVSIKTNFEFDASYVVNGVLGDHVFKGGYQNSKIFTDIDANSNVTTGLVQVFYGRPITQLTGPVTGLTASPTAIGAGLVSRFGQIAKGSNRNQGIYIQDKWTIGRRLTLNVGVRAEKEFIPTFNGIPIQVSYGWGDKVAPRIGGALDVFGDGKTKIFGSYGKFYDRLKFELPAGSFGGDFFRRDFFEIFPGEQYSFFTLSNILGNFQGPSGGACPVNQAGTRVRCHFDLRVPSLAVTDLKPFTQRELTFGFEREMFKNYLFTVRYTNKEVLDAVEDVGYFNQFGSEVYNIANPCKGQIRTILNQQGYRNCVEAERKFNGLQFSVERRLTKGFYFNANYTYSSLYGNYSGLASSDENGRDDPGVTRYFDIPIQGFAVGTGKADNGRLATDRPHVFNFYGSYTHGWFGKKNHESTVSLFTTAQSGAPITTTIEFLANEVIFNGRGDLGRLETFTQSDMAFNHRYKFGKDNRFNIVFNININNIFNEHNVTDKFRLITAPGIDISPDDIGFTDTIAAINAAITTGLGTQMRQFLNLSPTLVDARYNKPSDFQGGRNVRFGVRFSF